MEYFRLMLRGLIGDKRAVTAIEYALIASLVAVAAIGGFSLVGNKLSTTMSTISTDIVG